MRLSFLSEAVVEHVARNALDLEQIFTLHGHHDLDTLVRSIMATSKFAWVAWHDDEPVAVFGAYPSHKGVWSVYLVTTASFPKVVLPLSKFAKRTVVPVLFDQLGAHRLQVDLHEANTYVHRWVEALGATKESVKKCYAADGSDYWTFALLKSTNPTS